MTFAGDMAALFRRDLARLAQEIAALPDTETTWCVRPGVANSVGTLVLHLEGNLREFIGRQLGGIEYVRDRPAEFATTGLPVSALADRVEGLRATIPQIIEGLDESVLVTEYPDKTPGGPMSTRRFLIHLHGHLTYHLGQLDYLRRILTSGSAVPFVDR